MRVRGQGRVAVADFSDGPPAPSGVQGIHRCVLARRVRCVTDDNLVVRSSPGRCSATTPETTYETAYICERDSLDPDCYLNPFLGHLHANPPQSDGARFDGSESTTSFSSACDDVRRPYGYDRIWGRHA